MNTAEHLVRDVAVAYNVGLHTDAHPNDQPARINALQAALVEGEQSGAPSPVDFEAFKSRMRADHERTHA